nr:Gfo/Idh/MocA family oxidoreductase [Bacillus taeanensis]
MASGEIGDVKVMRVSLSFYFEHGANNIRMNSQLGGGSLYDVGCYCVHSIRNILGAEPNRVFASVQKHPESEVDMSSAGILKVDNGITAVFDAGMDRTRIDTYEVIGTKGSIRVPRAFIPQIYKGEASLLIAANDENGREETVIGHQYQLEVESFSKWVLEGKMPEGMMENTIHNLKVLDACFESVKKETFVNITTSSL